MLEQQEITALLQQLTAFDVEYDTIKRDEVKQLTGGVQNIALAIPLQDGRKFLLSVLRGDEGTVIEESRLNAEADWLDILQASFQKQGSEFSCATKVRAQGNAFAKVKFRDGEYYATLSGWLQNKPANEQTITRGHVESVGKLLAQMHNAGRNYDARALGDSPLTIEHIMAIADKYAKSERVAGLKQKLDGYNGEEVAGLQHIRTSIDVLGGGKEAGLLQTLKDQVVEMQDLPAKVQKLPQAICHKDAHAGNVMGNAEKVTAIFDWDWIGQDSAAYDMAMAVVFWSLEKRSSETYNYFNETKAKDVIASYVKERERLDFPMSREEKELLPELIKAGAVRFFARRLENVMTAAPQDIHRDPWDFIRGLEVIKKADLGKLVGEALLAARPSALERLESDRQNQPKIVSQL